MEKLEGHDSSSPLVRARKRLLQNQNINSDNLCFQRAKQSATDNTLLFESRFESGNLYMAQKVGEFEYNMLM